MELKDDSELFDLLGEINFRCQTTSEPVQVYCIDSRDAERGYCTSDISDTELTTAQTVVESLNYEPNAYDGGPSMDLERSHDRYHKINMHTKRGWTAFGLPGPSESWRRMVNSGMDVTLLAPCTSSIDRVSATAYLDTDLTKLTLLSVDLAISLRVQIQIDSIQVITPAMLPERTCVELTDLEMERAISLQYVAKNGLRTDACFLVESDSARCVFVEGLTRLWLEKRGSHETWF